MDMVKIGQICKSFRIDILNISLTDFAKKNNAKLQNIHAFESGRANNIRYIYMYVELSNDIELEILLEELFINL